MNKTFKMNFKVFSLKLWFGLLKPFRNHTRLKKNVFSLSFLCLRTFHSVNRLMCSSKRHAAAPPFFANNIFSSFSEGIPVRGRAQSIKWNSFRLFFAFHVPFRDLSFRVPFRGLAFRSERSVLV